MKLFEGRESDKVLDAAIMVCARWREILLDTPSLWTNIDFEAPTRARLYLKRSGTALVDVTLGKSKDTMPSPIRTFLGPTPWVSRVKSLRIESDLEQIKHIAGMLCKACPQLQSLTFEGKPRPYPYHSYGERSAGAIYVPPEFLGRHTPSLQSLTFHTVSPSVVFTFPLPKLTHIDWVAEAAHVVIEELLQLFVSSPLIEVIKMQVLIRRTQNYKPLRRVTLNNLRRLDWGDSNGLISLASCLVAPQLSDVRIRVTRSPQNPQLTLSSILHLHRDDIPLLSYPITANYICRSGVRSSQFTYEGSPFFYVCEGRRDRIINSSFGGWFSSGIPISFSAVQELLIEATSECPPIDDIPIEQFGSLKKLHLIGKADSLVPLIRSCPSLSEIEIIPSEAYFYLDKMVEILTSRKEKGMEPIKAVRIMGKTRCFPSEISQLKRLVKVVVAS